MYIDHLKVLFHIEKGDKYLDIYRSYGRASSFVLRVDWMAEVQEYDTVAAVMVFGFLLFMYLKAATLAGFHASHIFS